MDTIIEKRVVNILIIEVDKKQLNLLSHNILSLHSCVTIFGVTTIKEATALMKENHFDLFIMDIQLSDGNGLEYAEAIRQLDEFKFNPIIFITESFSSEIEAFRKVHCYDYILKPYSQKRLSDIISPLITYFKTFKNPQIEELVLNFSHFQQLIHLNDIIYIEYESRRIVIWTMNGPIKYRHMPLKTFKEKLPNYFVQIHQSFILNFRYFSKYDKINTFIELRCKAKKLPVGIRYKKCIQEYFKFN